MSEYKMNTPGPYEPRSCKGIPADCCDYGVVSLSAGKEVCRVWDEQDARAIASALAAAASAERMATHIAKLEAALVEERTWHEEQDKSLSKQPPSSGAQWERMQHRERIDAITAALAQEPS
jgi:hypothetical protein